MRDARAGSQCAEWRWTAPLAAFSLPRVSRVAAGALRADQSFLSPRRTPRRSLPFFLLLLFFRQLTTPKYPGIRFFIATGCSLGARKRENNTGTWDHGLLSAKEPRDCRQFIPPARFNVPYLSKWSVKKNSCRCSSPLCHVRPQLYRPIAVAQPYGPR